MAKGERIESEFEVQTYLDRLNYALKKGAQITVLLDRRVDEGRDIRCTNRFTVTDLFPGEDPVVALKRELSTLKTENYLRTVSDVRYPQRSEMREFGKVYEGSKEIYIKIRVELMTVDRMGGKDSVFVMSFHFSDVAFDERVFPHCK